MAVTEGTDSWTNDRLDPERPDVPHHPFDLQLSLPTNLDPSHVRKVELRSTSAGEAIGHARRALTEEGFRIVSERKLSMSHNAKSRSYPKGTEIVLSERNIRVDVTQNERGRKRSRIYFAGLAVSVALAVLLDLTFANTWWWTIPVAGAIVVCLVLGLLGITTSDFASEVVLVAILPNSKSGPGSAGPTQVESVHGIEVSGAFVLSMNYSSKGGEYRNLLRCAVTPGVSGAVDAVAVRLGGDNPLAG
jgi:hypothetical protein